MVSELDRMIWLSDALDSGSARQLLKDRRLSTRAVAREIGVSQPSVWRYLNRQQFPRRATALRLVRLLQRLEAPHA